jgi:hypothetical protein
MLSYKLSLFDGTVEDDMEYTLSLASMMKAPDSKKDCPDGIIRIKSKIRSALKGRSAAEAIKDNLIRL